MGSFVVTPSVGIPSAAEFVGGREGCLVVDGRVAGVGDEVDVGVWELAADETD